jgi:hypothetical protein
VAADDALEVHPQVAVVVLVLVAAARPARHDHAAAPGHERGDADGGPADVVEHHVRVLADGGADGLAEPFARRDRLLRRAGRAVAAQPDLVAVDDDVAAEPAQRGGLAPGADDPDRDAAGGLDELHRVRAEAAHRAPDQHDVAHLDPGAALADQHPVRRARAQADRRRLLPGEVRRLGHQLAGPYHRVVGEAAATARRLLPVTPAGRLLAVAAVALVAVTHAHDPLCRHL